MFIPAGRTSLVRRGELMLQVQTEYAYRPYPRITTTILNSGQVLHKVEKKLERAIDSIEEQNIAEDVMKRQHLEVLSLIQDPSGDARRKSERMQNEPTIVQRPKAAGAPPAAQLPEPEPLPELPELATELDPEGIDDPARRPYPSPAAIPLKESLHDRFADIPEFEHAYALTVDGLFKSEAAEEQFRKAFKHVHKDLLDVINVFPEARGGRPRREEGVFEVVRNRLYLVSVDEGLFLVSVRAARSDLNYEKVIKNLLFPDELQVYLQQRGRNAE